MKKLNEYTLCKRIRFRIGNGWQGMKVITLMLANDIGSSEYDVISGISDEATYVVTWSCEAKAVLEKEGFNQVEEDDDKLIFWIPAVTNENIFGILKKVSIALKGFGMHKQNEELAKSLNNAGTLGDILMVLSDFVDLRLLKENGSNCVAELKDGTRCTIV